MQPNIESQGFTYKTDCYKIIELFCNGETGISYALYELYKSIMIYHNGDIYVYDKNYTLWILQKK